ncbi:MAG: MTH1187 family thiamine-binding protein [Wenzhouxiangellaceae bacterium]|nr:MTH1187 family thiamine-binding protein [Wenzhouxiangellaceae bacterium]MBS3745716.1 MTH1187 family thiamine-binding protein [Wenzhouxiangellaceae bacterium]MBS3823273.1 MTH1187 family thiamine-binding protein [Wenzhouxiangellaceae bacterium]
MKNRNAIVEFSVTPVGGGTHLTDVIARITRIVRDSGLDNELHAMGTILEGDLDECMNVIRQCIDAALEETPRASTSVRIDAGEGRSGIADRVRSVEERLS